MQTPPARRVHCNRCHRAREDTEAYLPSTMVRRARSTMARTCWRGRPRPRNLSSSGKRHSRPPVRAGSQLRRQAGWAPLPEPHAVHTHTHTGCDTCKKHLPGPRPRESGPRLLELPRRHVRTRGRTELRWDGEQLAGASSRKQVTWLLFGMKFDPSVVLHASRARTRTASMARDQVAPGKAPASHTEQRRKQPWWFRV